MRSSRTTPTRSQRRACAATRRATAVRRRTPVTEPRHSNATAVLIAFVAVYLIWGSTYYAIRVAIETLPPLAMAGIRYIVAGAVMILWARARGAALPRRIQWRNATMIGA